eukprot:CAMPEP_0197826142 /NCGR_PEP_ID=MMETSP1437-20131217/3130_1 /TAXON_ID=49252 ORGANISM="Eucampia antarctica, Strain CCMP1452" /NCGR_SAMPLE_ID=MMETSP1437 /ASSEMBLY_ACC=CAM_ASM_001096 /LENGTH=425 /DNA_ID=CAMNT_0043426439 /DNA_START=64 /DNA_END=1338 /DNA_ORIENTATION=+
MTLRLRLFRLSAAIASVSSLISSRECPSYGCPRYPRDVMYDEKARIALGKLDRQLSEEEYENALNELKECGNNDEATMAMVGYKGGGSMKDQINQDRGFVLSPFVLDIKIPNCRILGVFDGHAKMGEIVSEYAVQEVPKRLTLKLELALTDEVRKDSEMTDIAVKRALVETFVEIDQEIPTKGKGGCTASVVLQLDSKLYIANAGDSVSLVASYFAGSDKVNVVYVSREDKPDLPDEYARITDMGGAVYVPTQIEKETYKESSRAIGIDPATGRQVGLAMSRSIGDWVVPGVIAEPIVDVLDINDIIADAIHNNKQDDSSLTMCADTDATDKDDVSSAQSEQSETCDSVKIEDVRLFAVSATDGLMDYLTPAEIARSFADGLYGKDTDHPLRKCNELINKAAGGWQAEMQGQYRDDITVAASKIW